MRGAIRHCEDLAMTRSVSYSMFFVKNIDNKTYNTITKGKATHWKTATAATATRRKIHRTSLPFHPADFILNEKNRNRLTIMNENTRVMPKQAQ